MRCQLKIRRGRWYARWKMRQALRCYNRDIIHETQEYMYPIDGTIVDIHEPPHRPPNRHIGGIKRVRDSRMMSAAYRLWDVKWKIVKDHPERDYER